MTISTTDTENKGHSLKNKHKIPEYPEIKVTATKHSWTVICYLEKSLFGLFTATLHCIKKKPYSLNKSDDWPRDPACSDLWTIIHHRIHEGVNSPWNTWLKYLLELWVTMLMVSHISSATQEISTIHRHSPGRTGESRQKKRKDERAPSNQKTRARQRAFCGDGVWEEARQNCLHHGKAGRRKIWLMQRVQQSKPSLCSLRGAAASTFSSGLLSSSGDWWRKETFLLGSDGKRTSGKAFSAQWWQWA